MYSMSYNGQPGQHGYMIEIPAEDGDAAPAGFQLTQKFLSDEMKDVFVADTFIAQVLAWRQSWVAYNADGDNIGRYPQFHSFKNNPVDGMAYKKSHMQVILRIEGVDEPIVFGGYGPSKTIQIDNDYSYKPHSMWPYGLRPQLEELAGQATEELATQITPHLTFMATFTYAQKEDGSPDVVQAGSGKHVTAVVPWCVITDENWRAAFVGQENYRQNLVWWDEHGKQWVKDWSTLEAIAEAEQRDRPDASGGLVEPGADALAALSDLPF